jgi:hypothetical protein
MRTRVVSLLGLAVFALPVAAVADGGAHAPPTLTPLIARDVAAACPGTAAYAEELARGIGERDAATAAPLFDACAARMRHGYSDLRRRVASTAVGATYLSLGLLRHDPGLLRKSIDATAEVRGMFPATSDEIHQWSVIPDAYDRMHRRLVVRTDCPFGGLAEDASYINVAAHDGSAWVTTPRAANPTCGALSDDFYALNRWYAAIPAFPSEKTGSEPVGSGRPSPAIEPDLANPGALGLPPPLSGH